jgi:hypothetical protein
VKETKHTHALKQKTKEGNLHLYDDAAAAATAAAAAADDDDDDDDVDNDKINGQISLNWRANNIFSLTNLEK